MRIRPLLALLASGAVMLGLAACSSGNTGSGGSGNTPSASSLEADAIAALKSAQSVRLSGTITQGGKSISIHMGFLRSGAVQGSMSGPFAGSRNIAFSVIITGGTAYVLVDKQFFTSVLQANGAPASACATYCGKYIKLPTTQFSGFNLKGLTNQVFKSNTKVQASVVTATVNGQAAYRISDTKGNYLYIAKNGTHYPLEITRPGHGALLFSEWNSVPPISPPPASQVISAGI